MQNFIKDWIKGRKIRNELEGSLCRYVSFKETLREYDTTSYPYGSCYDSVYGEQEFQRRAKPVIEKLIKDLKNEGKLSEDIAQERLDAYMSNLKKVRCVKTSVSHAGSYDHDRELFVCEDTAWEVPFIPNDS